MGKNAIYVWIGLAVLYVILWNANKNKEGKSGAMGRTPDSKMGVNPCFCNGVFLGYMNKGGCRKACKKSVKYETL